MCLHFCFFFWCFLWWWLAWTMSTNESIKMNSVSSVNSTKLEQQLFIVCVWIGFDVFPQFLKNVNINFPRFAPSLKPNQMWIVLCGCVDENTNEMNCENGLLPYFIRMNNLQFDARDWFDNANFFCSRHNKTMIKLLLSASVKR